MGTSEYINTKSLHSDLIISLIRCMNKLCIIINIILCNNLILLPRLIDKWYYHKLTMFIYVLYIYFINLKTLTDQHTRLIVRNKQVQIM